MDELMVKVKAHRYPSEPCLCKVKERDGEYRLVCQSSGKLYEIPVNEFFKEVLRAEEELDKLKRK